jgi:hypothetical protein
MAMRIEICAEGEDQVWKFMRDRTRISDGNRWQTTLDAMDAEDMAPGVSVAGVTLAA